MIVDWEVVCDNIVNISQVLADFLDTTHSREVEWVYIDENGNVNNIKLPNLAKVLENIKNNSSNRATSKPSIFINSSTTLDANTVYFVDTTVDNIVLSLPDNVNNNDSIIIIDARYNANNKPVTVECGNYKINNGTNNLICDVSGFLIELIYDSNNSTWYICNAVKGA